MSAALAPSSSAAAAAAAKACPSAPSVAGYGPARSWAARLDLGFVPRNGRTIIDRAEFSGPLRVQRPFYPEGEVCHVYALHPPGGLVSGDRLSIHADAAPGGHALLTTPSAGKIYGADSCNVLQGQEISLSARDGVLEWLPMETIIFDRANAVMSTTVELFGAARIVGWEILCLGRPEGGHPFESGRVEQKLSISRDGIPLLIERQVIEGGSDMMAGAYGLAGSVVCGAMYAAGFGDDPGAVLDGIRRALPPDARGMCASTHRRGVLATRYLGDSAEEARALFATAWSVIRPALLGREACPPRIWTT